MERRLSLSDQTNRLIYETGILNHRETKTSSGKSSPYYFEFSTILRYPKQLQRLARILGRKIEDDGIEYDCIAPVPFSPVPIATALSLETTKPLIIPRESKDHGNQSAIEGPHKPGERALVVEDVLSTGASARKIISLLEKQGLIVRDIVTLVDRDEGGTELFQKMGYTTHSLTHVMNTLQFGYWRKPREITYESFNAALDFYQEMRDRLVNL